VEVLLDTPFFVKHGRQGIPRWCFIGKMGVAGVASVIRTPSIRAVATVLFGLVLVISILMRSALQMRFGLFPPVLRLPKQPVGLVIVRHRQCAKL